MTKWCGLTAPHHQWQLKLQLMVTNRGKHPLGMSLSHFRLAVTHFNPSHWRPPRTQPGQRPFRGTYEGQRVWLVPANPDGVAEPYPPPRGNFTFATHWGAPARLAPHSIFHPRYRRGDAVFYLPRSSRQTHRGELGGVVGIAYTDGPHVIDICPPERWGPKVPASNF